VCVIVGVPGGVTGVLHQPPALLGRPCNSTRLEALMRRCMRCRTNCWHRCIDSTRRWRTAAPWAARPMRVWALRCVAWIAASQGSRASVSSRTGVCVCVCVCVCRAVWCVCVCVGGGCVWGGGGGRCVCVVRPEATASARREPMSEQSRKRGGSVAPVLRAPHDAPAACAACHFRACVAPRPTAACATQDAKPVGAHGAHPAGVL
jgi:hypothetical protein